ncbi:MAG TPA: glycosyltransferase N-terminal domain-containing protein [Candidatus Hydrothermia bacterium]|nr:hypothetical protein [Candidatus Hydrothermae bacterium]MDD3649107.1 glycosyltransferase N-terminal domain-containing protein [Candidatus Hydrothermia bacterium]MDD5572932.1 glycosyltransferase N-terminal domain-containing protein [Candidatus Hydrothermia bacterium]HOK23046.1 glycosyltransferase N-terminal domain-containing protein [Candidatus Hydrothermia bacterium]HOL23694.1 glycosyltransferase N-terminal domain-containing protein [Candidatus Hydrothermia bacterium]
MNFSGLYRFLTYVPLRLLSPLALSEVPKEKVDVWVHCASLGEVMAAKPIVDKFLERGMKLLISVFTKSGFQKALKLWPYGATVIRFPMDSYYHLKRIVESTKPDVFVNLETELWPNLIYVVAKNRIPAYLINARISEKNFKRSRLLKGTYSTMLRSFTKIFAQSECDAQRLERLGAPREIIQVVGNIKIDSACAYETGLTREDLGIAQEKFVILFASVREREEDLIINLTERIIRELSGCQVILAPRHVERVPEIAKELNKRKLEYTLWSKYEGVFENIVLIDTLGELQRFYGVVDVVIMGGTFASYGGHNILEPLAFGKTVIVGPYIYNIKDDVTQLLDKGGILRVRTANDIFELIERISKDRSTLQLIGNRAREWLNSKQGISKKIFEEILLNFEKR